MTYDELEYKFIGLATRVLPQEQASKIAATVRNLEKVTDLRDLTDLLVSPSSRTLVSSDASEEAEDGVLDVTLPKKTGETQPEINVH